jgi:hypothetical protein
MGTFKDIPANTKVKRELLLTCADVGAGGTSNPDWEIVGVGTDSSTISFESETEKTTDITGRQWAEQGDDTVSQELDPLPIIGGTGKFMQKVYDNWLTKTAIKWKMLIVFRFAGGTAQDTKCDAIMYDGCSIDVGEIGGDGGEALNFPVTINFAGNREVGTANVAANGTVTYPAINQGAQNMSVPAEEGVKK